MNKRIVIAAVIILGIVSLAIFYPRQTCDASAGTCDTPPSVLLKAVQIANEVNDKRATLLDVREPSEFDAGHAPSAVNVPLGDIEAGEYFNSDKTAKIYLYCQSGRRAGIAQAALKEQGYTNIESLGGLADWQSIGGTLVR